jgi:hypothetical protein
VQALDDKLDAGDKTVLLGLSNPSGGPALGTPSTAVLHVRDTDVAGRLHFSLAAYTVRQSAGQALVKVTRSGGAAGGVSVHYATSDGTAVAPADYTSVSGTLTFGARVMSRSFTVPIVDTGAKGDLTVNLALSDPGGSAALGERSTAVLTIQSGQMNIQFAAASYLVGEVGHHATIAVRRTGPVATAASVDFATTDGTATAAGGDYAPISGSLSFPPGVRTRIFSVPVSNDALLEGDETVNLSLSNPQPVGVAFLGVRQAAVLTIRTASPEIQFARSRFTVSEAAARATIVVTRRPPTKPVVTVDYSTSDDTAVAGTDYVPTSGTLTLASGVSRASFAVKLLHNTAQQGTRNVTLTLGNPGAGARLGDPSAATLSIGDVDVAGSLQFALSDFSVSETGPVAVITVFRAGGNASGVSVDYATSDGSAQAGVNYLPASGTLTFEDGDTARSFTVGVLDDGQANGNKTVNLTLTHPRGGAALGARTTARLWLVENR